MPSIVNWFKASSFPCLVNQAKYILLQHWLSAVLKRPTQCTSSLNICAKTNENIQTKWFVSVKFQMQKTVTMVCNRIQISLLETCFQ